MTSGAHWSAAGRVRAGDALGRAGCGPRRWLVGSGAKGEGRRSRERAERGLGPRGEERGGELGRPGEREREEETDRAGLGSGPQGRKKGLRAGVGLGVLGWIGLGVWFFFFNLFYFYSIINKV